MKCLTLPLSFVVLFGTPLNTAGTTASRSNGETTGAVFGHKSMGVENYILLFDTRVYKEKVLPAYRAFFERDDSAPLILLLKEVVRRIDAEGRPQVPRLWPKEVYEEAIGILDGSVYYDTKGSHNPGGRKTTRKDKRIFVRDSLGYDLIVALCVPRGRGFDTEQGLTTTRLSEYLGGRSEWIEQLVMGERQLRGGTLEVGGGDAPLELFSKDDVREFAAELGKMTPPDELVLKAEYDNLVAMTKAALADADLTLVRMLA